MRYEKASPHIILFKYDNDDEFKQLRVNQGTRGGPTSLGQNEVSLLYREPPALSKAKIDDFQFLCHSMAIPHTYHAFYKDLRYDGQVADRLTEPDATEDNVEDDGEQARVYSIPWYCMMLP